MKYLAEHFVQAGGFSVVKNKICHLQTHLLLDQQSISFLDLFMDDLKHEFLDVDEVKEGSSFVEALAKYYSDFLATDFKKGSLPKRRFQTRDKKGRRSGITLEKFSSFQKQREATESYMRAIGKWR